MIDLRVYLDDDRTIVGLEIPDGVLMLSAHEIEEFVAVLTDIRSQMSPPAGARSPAVNGLGPLQPSGPDLQPTPTCTS
jgi:hypothetical protein